MKFNLSKFKSLFNKTKKEIKETQENNKYQFYETYIIPDDNKIMIFQDETQVEVFKLEQEQRECQTKIDEINKTLKPWEEEMRKHHRKLWGY